MLPAQRSWRETVWLLDVMWPKVTNERARCCEKICSYITKVDTESSYKHPWRGVVHHCGPSLFLLSVAGDISFISFTGVAWDGKWEWWPRHMPENQRVLPSWSSWESICYVGIKISKLYELRNITLLEWLALHLCSHSRQRQRQRGRVVTVSDSQSGGPGFESRSGHLLDLCSVVPSSNSRPRL